MSHLGRFFSRLLSMSRARLGLWRVSLGRMTASMQPRFEDRMSGKNMERPALQATASPGSTQGMQERASYTSPDDWVFASEVSFGRQPLWPGTLWRRNVAPAIKQAGITKPKVGWHSLRRSYASLLLSSGASLRVSMELMRHSTAEMTLSTYAQTVGDEKREAGGRVAALVLPGREGVEAA